MGTPPLAVPTVDAIARVHDLIAVLTQPDRPRGRGRRQQLSAVKTWALEHSIAIEQPASLRTASAQDALARRRPQVVVVVAYGLILPPAVLSLPPLGCVNLHASLLPLHRGASPIQAAILAADAVTGVTTMLMDEGLDTGPILLQRQETVRDQDTAAMLGDRLAELGAQLVIETLGRLAQGNLEPRPQEDQAATMTRLIRKRDGRIDWERSPAAIDRLVRAMQPWPSAWTDWGDTRLQLWKVEPVADTPGAPPGQIVRVDTELVVACGGGAVRILELQRAGGKRLLAGEFMRGARLQPGDRLGASS